MFVRSRGRELATSLGGSIMVPPWVAAPLLLAALVPAVVWGNALIWGIFWVLLTLTVVAVVVLAAAMLFATVSLSVCGGSSSAPWELRPSS